MDKRLWLALHFADLSDADSLTRIVVDFCLAPARAAQGLNPPRPDEGESFILRELPPVNGVRQMELVQHQLQVSAAHFERVVRGLLLFGWLFPDSTMGTDAPEEVLALPGSAFMSDSQQLAHRTYEEMAYLAAGLIGVRRRPPIYHGTATYRAQRNEEALAQLAAMKGMIARAVGKPEDFGDYRRIDHGFPALGQSVALLLDEILRQGAHQRIAWLGTWEDGVVEDDDVQPWEEPDHGHRRDDDEDDQRHGVVMEYRRYALSPLDLITFDRGVLTAALPESISALVALDFAESLRLDRAAGRCARCRQPMLLTAQQAAAAKRGRQVFDRECFRQHRLEYGRDYQRRRAQRVRGLNP